MKMQETDIMLYENIPEEKGRLPREMEVYRLLTQLRIPFKRLDHEPMATIEACQGIDKILGIHMCKNLFLCNSQKTYFYLLLMPGEKKLKTKDVIEKFLPFTAHDYQVVHLTGEE